jgi:hypothetical protein
MPNDIGSVTSIRGTSMALNTQSGESAQKPSATGKDNPGDTKPPKPPSGPVPMPK